MLKLYQNDSIKDWKMKNIDTILSTFLTAVVYIKLMQYQNALTSLPLSQTVFFLSVGIYDPQTDLLLFFLISKLN